MGISSRLVLPCLATGCHADHFKIATAALRPRNDTKSERFCLGNGRFCFIRPFCAVLPRIVFQTFRSENCSVFQQNLPVLSLRGGRVRPTRQSLTERFAIPERGMMKRNEPESENEAKKAVRAVLPVSRLPLWVFLLASCFRASPRDAMLITLRLPRCCAPRNDTKMRRFYLRNKRSWLYEGAFD